VPWLEVDLVQHASGVVSWHLSTDFKAEAGHGRIDVATIDLHPPGTGEYASFEV